MSDLGYLFWYGVRLAILCILLEFGVPGPDPPAILYDCLLGGGLTPLAPTTNMSLVVRKPVFGFPTRSHTNQAVQPQKMARGLKFRI